MLLFFILTLKLNKNYENIFIYIQKQPLGAVFDLPYLIIIF